MSLTYKEGFLLLTLTEAETMGSNEGERCKTTLQSSVGAPDMISPYEDQLFPLADFGIHAGYTIPTLKIFTQTALTLIIQAFMTA